MMRHMGILCALALLLCAEMANGCRDSTLEAMAQCTRDDLSAEVSLNFRLELNNEQAGAFEVYQNADPDCPIVQDNDGYNIRITIDNTRPFPRQGECGFRRTGGISWDFMYFEFAGRKDIDAGKNRMFTVTCDFSNTIELTVNATIRPSVPNLEQDVTVYRPGVSLYILAQTGTGNSWEIVDGQSSVPTQTPLKLRLVLNYVTLNLNRYTHIAGLRTIVSRFSDFRTSQPFLDSLGCTEGPLGPSYGFTVAAAPANQPVVYRETEPFPAFMFDYVDAEFVYFKTWFGLCMGLPNSDAFCNDPCDNPLRKKRADEEEEPKERIVKIRVVRQKPAAKTSDDDTMIYGAIGAAIGVAACLCLLLCVAMIVFMTRRNKRRRCKKMAPPPYYANDAAKIPY